MFNQPMPGHGPGMNLRTIFVLDYGDPFWCMETSCWALGFTELAHPWVLGSSLEQQPGNQLFTKVKVDPPVVSAAPLRDHNNFLGDVLAFSARN